MKAAFSSHDRVKFYNFAGLEAGNKAAPDALGTSISPPDWWMSPMSPAGKRTTGFQLAVHIISTVFTTTDPRTNVVVPWTDSAGGTGFGITVWRLDPMMGQWSQFKKLTGLLRDMVAVTSDTDAAELFLQFDPATLANPAGAVLVSLTEI